MNFEEVVRRIDRGLMFFLTEDNFLLENNLNERTISHKLAGYIQNEFSDWDVDCEYNRNIDRVKRVTPVYIFTDDTDANTVYPDIIVHIRNTEQNLLVIEIKKKATESSKNNDINKIKSFIRELNYRYGLFIDFETGNKKTGIKQKLWFK